MEHATAYEGGEWLEQSARHEQPARRADHIRLVGAGAMAAAAPTVGEQLMLDLQWDYKGKAEPVDVSELGRVAEVDMQKIELLLRSMVEVLEGRRPLTLVQSRVAPRLYAALQTTLRESHGAKAGLRLRSLHAYQPAKGVVEACGVVSEGKHAKALAARFERKRRGWFCTVLRLLQPRRS